MAKRKAQKSVRDVVRDTFTPSRVGLLSWAFAAVCMGTVGLASYQFSNTHGQFTPKFDFPTGITLPPVGSVGSTASITSPSGRGVPVEVMQLPEDSDHAPLPGLDQSQIAVLQKEIVGLRRRLSALAEQNLAYSRRIAALEKEAAFSRLSEADNTGKDSGQPVEPSPGIVRTEVTEKLEKPLPVPVASPKAKRDASKLNQTTSAAPDQADTKKQVSTPALDVPKAPPRMVSIESGTASVDAPTRSFNPAEPVRIVDLPRIDLPAPGGEPQATGSIPLAVEDNTPSTTPSPEPFDATPTQTTSRPAVITPSSPAGRLRGGGDSKLKRSDFGAIIGHYSSTAAAAKAWADFKNQNAERMRDLRPLLMERNTDQGGIALMVGPFANAADAAVACLHLLDVTELCHPALFAGDPLVTAAEFRDTAF